MIKRLEKNCTTSKDGKIALSNTLVETAIKIHNCPIRVTCADYPNEESIYSVSDLSASVPVSGPYPDQFRPGKTYSLLHFEWKGTPIVFNKESEEEFEEEQEVAFKAETKEENLVEALEEIKPRKGYYMMEIPVITTTYQRIEVNLTEYIGKRVTAIRQERGLTQLQLANLTGKLSQTAISTVEAGAGNPQLHSLQVIAEAFGIELMELMPPHNS